MLPDSNIARSFHRVAGTLTTSMPVAFVNGSKIAFTLASSYDPPIVRMTTLPAAPARGTQTNGRVAARDAVIPAALPRSVRSIIGVPSCARGVPGALNRRASGRVVGIVGGTSRFSITQPSKVSRLPAAVEPVLEALPVDHQRHGRQTPGVERHG